MSQKNTLPIIVAVVAILLIGGGAIAYFASNMKNDAVVETAQAPDAAPVEGEDAAQDSAQAPAAAPAPGNEAPEGIEVEPGNPVVARVDGREITRVDVYRYIQMMPPNIQQLPATAVYPLALDQVVNTRLVQNKAEDANLENDPEVQEQLELARQQIVRTVFVQRAVEREISDADIRAAYDQYVRNLPAVKERRAGHILVESEDEALSIIEQLANGEANFAELAAQHSQDPGNKDAGGDLGWFSREEMVREFADAAFTQEIGTLSMKPVQTQFGYHVVLVTEERDRPKPSFEELKENVAAELRRQKLEEMLSAWRDSADIETFDINGDPLPQDQAPAAGNPAPMDQAQPQQAPVAAE